MSYLIPRKRTVETVRIVSIYALFGLAWIYGSDTVIGWLSDDPAVLLQIALLKGSLFIICTAILLYFLISRFLQQLARAEGERTESLKNYRIIFNATDEAIFVHDIESGRIVEVNDRMLEMYGYTHPEALAAQIGGLSEGTHPYDQECALAWVRRAVSDGAQVFQWRSRRKNGELFWSEVSLRGITVNGRERIIAVVRDVTDRKKKEDAIREKNAHLSFFFEYAPASLAMFDREMRYLQVSRRWKSDFGLEERDVIGCSHYDVFPEVTERWKEFHRRGLAGETLHEEAEEFLRADGSVQWLRWEIRPWYESEERIGGIVIFSEDITERKNTDNALRANERFLRMLTDQLPGLVGYWDRDLTCSFANRAYYDYFNCPEDGSVLGRSMRELMGEEVFSQVEPYARGALAGEAQHFQASRHKANGEPYHVYGHYIPDLVQGTARGFFALITDVTELKVAEEEKVRLESQLQQAQKMESVGRLAGGVAHDFNNLLTVILGFAQIGLNELPPGHPVRARFDGIRQAAEKSAGLTRQLLGFARQQTIAPRVLDLNGTVENMLMMLRRLIGEDIDLAWQPAGDLWRVKIDPSQVDQILANLCVNARDAIADVGKITIDTANRVFDKEYCAANYGFNPGEYVQLAVSDNGCGMDKVTLAHVFEPFFTTKGMGQGTGLGLATVYGIVKQNNGFINTYSEPGQGTTFKVYLPRHRGAEEQPQLPAAAKALATGRETVLLVEDEPSIREVTAALLETQGYRVHAAGSPSEALELARRHADRIDLLLTDVVMPEMNGRDLVRHLVPLCPGIKCLFMSGYTANVIAHHGVLDQGVHFISKPFSQADLSAKVREVLDTGGDARTHL